MIYAKGIPTFPTPPIVKAHSAAMVPLRALVAAHNEAQDYELLGVVQVRTDDEAGAGSPSEGARFGARSNSGVRRCADS